MRLLMCESAFLLDFINVRDCVRVEEYFNLRVCTFGITFIYENALKCKSSFVCVRECSYVCVPVFD